MLSCKDTNFKANHNCSSAPHTLSRGVCYLAKIRILKQITTALEANKTQVWCLLSCKDTNFKANHNKASLEKAITTTQEAGQQFYRCLLSCKDTNFKANHNYQTTVKLLEYGVCYLAKIRILKQITTLYIIACKRYMVFVILQRYEF